MNDADVWPKAPRCVPALDGSAAGRRSAPAPGREERPDPTSLLTRGLFLVCSWASAPAPQHLPECNNARTDPQAPPVSPYPRFPFDLSPILSRGVRAIV